MENYNFKVDLGGMIDILSNHLYSEKKVFLRELLQNATDAIQMRSLLENSYQGEVTLEIVEGTVSQIVFEDNGVGLSEDEVHQFLANIGASIKRNKEVNFEKHDFIGQFGIGLLSCFMITDEIVMITRSAKDKNAKTLEWRGNSDGTYSIKELSFDKEPGTIVYLTAKEENNPFFTKKRIKEMVQYYGDLLPFPIFYKGEIKPLNDLNHPLRERGTEDLLSYGKAIFDIDFFDAFTIQTSKGNTKGIAYIMPFAQNFSAKQSHRVYLRDMFLTETADSILPSWAIFVKCVINSDNLRPTASREHFYEDENLELTREQLGLCIKEYLKKLSKNNPHQFKQFLHIHHHNIKLLALEDDDFYRIIIDELTFPSTLGSVTLPEFLEVQNEILHIDDVDDFKQIASVAVANGKHVINSGYMYDADIIRRVNDVFLDRKVQKVNTSDFIQEFTELTTEEYNATFQFVQSANETLREFKCDVLLKRFKPNNVATLYYANESMNVLKNAQKSQELTDHQAWGNIMENIKGEVNHFATAQLVFNYNHSLVQKLAAHPNPEIQTLYVRILYVQSLMQGYHPVNNKEMDILGKDLAQLLEYNL